jgi:acid phosphatase
MLQSGAAFALGAVAPGELAAAEINASLVDGTFLAVGDWGRGNATQWQVAAGMARIAEEKPIGFVISTGDNFYKGGVKSTDDRLWKELFEDVYSSPSLTVPWYPVLGNHDHKGNAMAQVAYSQISARWSMPGPYYWRAVRLQDGSNADLFFLDTTPFVAKSRGIPRYLAARRDNQFAWLEQALATSKARWKIVIGHHPLFSGGKHGSTNVLIKLLQPLFERYGVNVYLNGHDHDLQHVVVNGIDYVTSGAGASPRPTGNMQGTHFASSEPGFLRGRLSRTGIEIEFIDASGGRLYSATLA